MRSVASVSVCLSVCNALTFENLVLESSLFGMPVQLQIASSYFKVIGSRSRSQDENFSWYCILADARKGGVLSPICSRLFCLRLKDNVVFR